MALDLFEETVALLGELERRGTPYALAGAIALAIHGAPRATTDTSGSSIDERRPHGAGLGWLGPPLLRALVFRPPRPASLPAIFLGPAVSHARA